MSIKQLLEERIKILNSSIVFFNRLSSILLGLAVICLLVSLGLIPFSILHQSQDILKFGFTTMAGLTPIGLQGWNYPKKAERLNYKFTFENLDRYDELKPLEKTVIDKVLAKLTS